MSPIERMKLQKQWMQLANDSKATANPIAKMKIQREILVIHGQLGYGVSAPVIESETPISIPKLEVKSPNKNIVLGFDGVNGIRQGDPDVDGGFITVYTNLRGGDHVKFSPRDLDSHDGKKASYLDAYVGSDSSNQKLKQIIHDKDNKKSVFDQTASKASIERFTKAAKIATDFINNAFPIEHNGFTINTGGLTGFYVEKDETLVFEQYAIKNILQRIDNGELQLVIDAKKEEKRIEAEQRHSEYLADKAIGNKSNGFVTDDQFKDVKNYFDNDVKLVNGEYEFNYEYAELIESTLENFYQKRLKLSPEQVAHVNEVIKYMRGNNFNLAQSLMNTLAKNENLTAESDSQQSDATATERLISAGGKLWEKGDIKRIYFDPKLINEWGGLNIISRGAKGVITDASLNGDSISAGFANQMAATKFRKLWFDVNTNTFEYSKFDNQIVVDNAIKHLQSVIEGAPINNINSVVTNTGINSNETPVINADYSNAEFDPEPEKIIPFVAPEILGHVREMDKPEFTRWAKVNKGMSADVAESLFDDARTVLNHNYVNDVLSKPEQVALEQVANALKKSPISPMLNKHKGGKGDNGVRYFKINNGLFDMTLRTPWIHDDFANFSVETEYRNKDIDIRVDVNNDGTLPANSLKIVVDNIVKFVEKVTPQTVDLSGLPDAGSKTDEYTNDKELAALVRKEIKDAIKTGKLPNIKTSVRMQRGYSTVYVTVNDMPDSINMFNDRFLNLLSEKGQNYSVDDLRSVGERYTIEAKAIIEYIERLFKARQWRDYDPYADYPTTTNFSFDVKFDYIFEQKRQKTELAEFKNSDHPKDLQLGEAVFANTPKPKEPEQAAVVVNTVIDTVTQEVNQEPVTEPLSTVDAAEQQSLEQQPTLDTSDLNDPDILSKLSSFDDGEPQPELLDHLIGKTWNSNKGEAEIIAVSNEKQMIGVRYSNTPNSAEHIKASNLDSHVKTDESRYQDPEVLAKEQAEQKEKEKSEYDARYPKVNEYLDSLSVMAAQKAKIRDNLESVTMVNGEPINLAKFANNYALNGAVNDSYGTPKKARWSLNGFDSFVDGMTKTVLDFATWQGIKMAGKATSTPEPEPTQEQEVIEPAKAFSNSELDEQYLKLTKLEANQEKMKKVNALLRKSKNEVTPEYLIGMAEMGYDEAKATEFAQPDFAGRIGFAGYQLTNNNANIKRVKGRITELKSKLEAQNAAEDEPEDFDLEIDGVDVNVTVDYDDNRIRVAFGSGRPVSGSPEMALKDEFKSRAFKWSGRNGAWQRVITDNAKYATAKALGFNGWDDLVTTAKSGAAVEEDEEMVSSNPELDNAIDVIKNVISNPVTDFMKTAMSLHAASQVIVKFDMADEYEPLLNEAAMKLQAVEEANQ